jgi:hypothetical protein
LQVSAGSAVTAFTTASTATASAALTTLRTTFDALDTALALFDSITTALALFDSITTALALFDAISAWFAWLTGLDAFAGCTVFTRGAVAFACWTIATFTGRAITTRCTITITATASTTATAALTTTFTITAFTAFTAFAVACAFSTLATTATITSDIASTAAAFALCEFFFLGFNYRRRRRRCTATEQAFKPTKEAFLCRGRGNDYGGSFSSHRYCRYRNRLRLSHRSRCIWQHAFDDWRLLVGRLLATACDGGGVFHFVGQFVADVHIVQARVVVLQAL